MIICFLFSLYYCSVFTLQYDTPLGNCGFDFINKTESKVRASFGDSKNPQTKNITGFFPFY